MPPTVGGTSAPAAVDNHVPGRSRSAAADAVGPRQVSVDVVRLQEFWSRLEQHFGSMRSQSVARDHVFSVLGGRTALDAIDAGVPVRKVWLAICEEYDVPPKER